MKLTTALLTAAAATLSLSATAQEDAIRKALAQRIPQMDKIDEVRPTPMKGLYEVRIGTDLFYTDAQGNPGPVRRNDGSIIPDQADTVFATP